MAISVDDREHARLVWEKVVDRQFTILSDPAAQVIRTYGLVHSRAGKEGEDIALDTTLLVDADGREHWRRVSATLPDIPSADEIFRRIRESPNPSSREVWRGDVGRLNQYVEAGHIPSSQINTKFVTHSS